MRTPHVPVGRFLGQSPRRAARQYDRASRLWLTTARSRQARLQQATVVFCRRCNGSSFCSHCSAIATRSHPAVVALVHSFQKGYILRLLLHDHFP